MGTFDHHPLCSRAFAPSSHAACTAAGNTTQFSTAFPAGGDGTAPMEEATDASGLEGFDLFAAARGGGDVTRGVPSLADVAAADEVRADQRSGHDAWRA